MDVLPIILFVVGLGLLVGGAEVLVRGASRLAVTIGISPLVVGLTVVSFGTSSPELAVSVQSAWSGQADIALGNVIGSNIFNILVVLGLCATVIPLIVSRQLIRLDVPIMIGASFLMLLLAFDGAIGRLDGLLLTAALVAYIVFTIWQSRKEQAQIAAEAADDDVVAASANKRAAHVISNIFLIGAGLGLLVIGSNWLVDGAVTIAQALGVSQLIIGLTIIAMGTSLPEVATSVVAAFRGERDIAVGNVVGSCIFNILAILGLTAVVSPSGVGVPTAAIWFDIPVMIGVAVVCLPIFFTGFVVSRREGGLLLGYYVVYTLMLILTAAQQHEMLGVFNTAISFLVPATAIALIVQAARIALNNHREHGSVMGEVVSS